MHKVLKIERRIISRKIDAKPEIRESNQVKEILPWINQSYKKYYFILDSVRCCIGGEFNNEAGKDSYLKGFLLKPLKHEETRRELDGNQQNCSALLLH